MTSVPFLDVVQALFEAPLIALLSRAVIAVPDQIVWHGLHVGDFVLVEMRQLVALAVANFLHELGRGVAQMQGNWLVHGLLDILGSSQACLVNGIGLGCQRQVNHCLGQVNVALWHAQKLTGLENLNRKRQRACVCQPNVLRCKANQAPCDIERVFTAIQHPRHPVNGRVRVAVAHGLVERRDDIVMLLAGLIVKEHLFLQKLLHDVVRHCDRPVHFLAVEHRHFQRIERRARVPIGIEGNLGQVVLADGYRLIREGPFVFENMAEQADHFLHGQLIKDKDLAA